MKKINEVIRSFAQIDVYLNAGKKNMQELKIIKFLLSPSELLNFNAFKKKIGRIMEVRQKINLIMYGSLTMYSTKDKIMKWSGVCTKVNWTGSTSIFSCKANING